MFTQIHGASVIVLLPQSNSLKFSSVTVHTWRNYKKCVSKFSSVQFRWQYIP